MQINTSLLNLFDFSVIDISIAHKGYWFNKMLSV